MPHITPNLWFDGNALEAAEFYCSIFPNSKITTVTHHTVEAPAGRRVDPTSSFTRMVKRYPCRKARRVSRLCGPARGSS